MLLHTEKCADGYPGNQKAQKNQKPVSVRTAIYLGNMKVQKNQKPISLYM